MGWLFNRKKKVEYVYGKLNAIHINTLVPDYSEYDRKAKKPKWKYRNEIPSIWPYGFYVWFSCEVAEKTEGAKDYYKESESFFEDIRFDIIANITKGLPCFVSLDLSSSPCASSVLEVLKIEKESQIYSKHYKEYIGLKYFTRKLYDEILKSAESEHYDVDYGISFPLLTKEEIENDKYYESNYTDIENCYMLIGIGLNPLGLDFEYNPNTKGFREEEVFERIREVVEDKYHLQLVINR